MWRRNRTRQPSDLHLRFFLQSLETTIYADESKFMRMFRK